VWESVWCGRVCGVGGMCGEEGARKYACMYVDEI
jgi:hypothetical protein